jgi:hypothetical protein
VDAGEAGEGNLEILVSALDTNIPTRLGLVVILNRFRSLDLLLCPIRSDKHYLNFLKIVICLQYALILVGFVNFFSY